MEHLVDLGDSMEVMAKVVPCLCRLRLAALCVSRRGTGSFLKTLRFEHLFCVCVCVSNVILFALRVDAVFQTDWKESA